MENAAEALKMAAWVLIFIVALSFSMNALTFVKQNVDSILTSSDREYLTKYVEGNKDSNDKYTTERIVGMEAIVPTIYRAFEEELVLKFPYALFKIGSTEVKEIDNRKLKLSKLENAKSIEYFIKGIMKGYLNNEELKSLKQDLGTDYEDIKFLGSGGLYRTLTTKTKNLYEYTEIYYVDDINGEETKPEAQKTEQRIIIFSEGEL